MGPDPLISLSEDAARAHLLAREARQSGDWGPWRHTLTKGTPFEMSRILHCTDLYENDAFWVLTKTMKNGVVHLCTRSYCATRPSWGEFQRIKDELVGKDRTGVEVYPQSDEMTYNTSFVFHMWVLPRGARLPFSLADDRDEPWTIFGK